MVQFGSFGLNPCSPWLRCVEGIEEGIVDRPLEKRGGRRTLLINASFLFSHAAEGAAAASVTNTFISSLPSFLRSLGV